MTKAINDPREIFEEIVQDYKSLFGQELESIILYGSAAGSEYVAGKSDINFMIVLSEQGIDHLDRAFKTVEKWKKRKVATPLFLTRFYVETSTDTFPIEYLNFKHNHITVYGDDILKTLSFDTKHVRLQCEREIKGKLTLLRQAYIESAGKGKNLRQVITQSIRAFIAIFRALLFLKGEEPPSEMRKIVQNACQALSLDSSLFEKLLDIKQDKIKPTDEEIKIIYGNYLKEVRKLSKLVDSIGG